MSKDSDTLLKLGRSILDMESTYARSSLRRRIRSGSTRRASLPWPVDAMISTSIGFRSVYQVLSSLIGSNGWVSAIEDNWVTPNISMTMSADDRIVTQSVSQPCFMRTVQRLAARTTDIGLSQRAA